MCASFAPTNTPGFIRENLPRPVPPPPPRPDIKVAFIGSYPPRKCGIATFTQDLRMAMLAGAPGQSFPVIAMGDGVETYDYPPEVVLEIAERDGAGYERAADFLNRSDVEVVSVQHEFGIYGGSAGSHLLHLLRALQMPVVTTLHTVLRDPDPGQRRVMDELIKISARVVVMSERGRGFLREIYQAPADKIDLIPHGIHDVPFEDPDRFKKLFSLEGRAVLLTFGLLSPNKGIENVLNALPAIIAEFPEVIYLVLGATHPNLVREQGETYRLGLERLAKTNGVSNNVIFHSRFVNLPELKDFIGATDVYITPYLHEQQIVSGTLAYAFGAGKAVVSTPFWHAAELLADGRGVLVPFGDAAAIADAVRRLLRDKTGRDAIRLRAHQCGRAMIWSEAATSYSTSLVRARVSFAATRVRSLLVQTPALEPMRLPRVSAAHIARLSDSTGILQHARYSVPSYTHGYCTDDNARALILTLAWDELGELLPESDALANTFLAFLAHAWDPASRRFRNFMGYDRRWDGGPDSEDAHGRALWALGLCAGQSRDRGRRLLAGGLFRDGLMAAADLAHPRTWAFVLLGIHAYLQRYPGDDCALQTRALLTSRLQKRFEEHSRDGWHWLADDATYDNARLPHAMILSGHAMQQPDVLAAGMDALRWLLQIQTAPCGYFQPIGCDGFCHRNGTRARFDQQPVEVQATVSACIDAYRISGETSWLERARAVFEWFLGRNDLGLMLYDPRTGGCRDALHSDRVNENQGAESSIAFQTALADLQRIRRDTTEPVMRPSSTAETP